jgi:hypothetical protein
MCMTYEESFGLWYRKLKLKVVIIFSVIWNYDYFSRQNVDSSRICTFLKNSYLFKKN